MNTKKISVYNIIRVMATLLVVIGHAGYTSMITPYGGISFGEYTVPNMQKIIDLGIRLIYSFHMPLFFALSGALFRRNVNNGKFESLKSVLSAKSKRLLIPFACGTLLWVIPIKALSGYWDGSTNVIFDMVIGQLFLFGNNHLWFLWVLFVITIIAWVLRNNSILRLTIAIILFAIGGVIDISALGLSDILLNFIWFEMGYQFEQYRPALEEKLSTSKKKLTMYSIITTVIYSLCVALYLYFAKGNEYAYGVVHATGIIMTMSFAMLIPESSLDKKCYYKLILSHSMGIYLYSDTLNYIILALIKKFNWIMILESNIGSLALFLTRIILTLIIAIFVDIIVKKIKQYYFHRCSLS